MLLHKLRSLGFNNLVLGRIVSFLSGRSFSVAVSGVRSSWREVESGVPQGSVLGPLLFIIYVNFLMAGTSCTWFSYADDFKICINYKSPADNTEAESLQSDLDHVYSAAASWNLFLNPEKCVVVRFGDRAGRSNREYSINGNILHLKDNYKDLGIIVDNSLKFHLHIRSVVQKVGGTMSNLLKCTVCRSASFMVALYMSHIRPIMDYGSCVWNMQYLSDVRLLESTLRRWTREIVGVQTLSYKERLKSIGLHSVWGRLLRADLVKV